MSRSYSTYEAKAKFSEIIQRVRRGQASIITYRGKEVAEVRPISEGERSLEDRIEELEAHGLILAAADPEAALEPLAKRPGALARFLEERD